MTLTPKADFNRNKSNVKQWNEMTGSRVMQEAALAAWAQMNLDMSGGLDGNLAAANDFRRQGAKMFLDKLLGLTDPEAPQPKPVGPPANLDYRK